MENNNSTNTESEPKHENLDMGFKQTKAEIASIKVYFQANPKIPKHEKNWKNQNIIDAIGAKRRPRGAFKKALYRHRDNPAMLAKVAAKYERLVALRTHLWVLMGRPIRQKEMDIHDLKEYWA